ncbi:MAG: CDP-diacylglycerol--serine O-phosphatidyltransferase [Alphaproteobacteria bacterium]|nr:CDP-diacylglycerol--serine O-phosphatidyltransferase [Alphaproteobacteria bacterium]
MRPARENRLPPFVPVRALAPTVLTVLALCSGVTSMRYAFQERWEAAVVAILLASLFDALDGRVARLIKGTTKFGAELDSLSDVICFGVAPALVLYLWTLHDVRGIGWAVVLLYCVCCALRLARFNIMDQNAGEDGTIHRFFMGMPAPAAAGLAMAPLALTFYLQDELFRQPVACTIYLGLIALMMISRVPTFSAKYIRISRHYVMPILLGVGVLVALLTSYFWATYVGLAAVYAISLPVGVVTARRDLQRKSAHLDAADEGLDEDDGPHE